MTRSEHCPSCSQSLLDPIEAHGSSAAACTRCGGLWFEAGKLATAIQHHDPGALPPGLVASAVGAKRGASRDRCPSCEHALGVYDLSESNPVRVEICQACSGVWLPHGNLDRVLAGHQLKDAEETLGTERTWSHWLMQLLTGLPVEFNIKPRATPVVTRGLILLNGLIFLASVNGAVPVEALAVDPAGLGTLPWLATLFTSQFLHAGLIHLLGNMYFLWILGDNVEDVLGRPSFLAFYLGAGVAGDILYSVVADPGQSAIGASGAISGVLGLYALLFRRSKLTFMLLLWQWKLSTPLYVGIWATFNLVGWLRASPGVAWEAHVGGCLFGVAVGLVGHRYLLRQRPLLRLLNSGASHARNYS